MHKISFSLENRKENAFLASVHFIRYENVIKNMYPNFRFQLWNNKKENNFQTNLSSINFVLIFRDVTPYLENK